MSRPSLSRNAKIAVVAALAGLMFVVAVETFREPGHRPLDAILPLLEEDEAAELLALELKRCATLTTPDKDCETAWAEKRRRFFGGKDVPMPAPESIRDYEPSTDQSRERELPLGPVSDDIPLGPVYDDAEGDRSIAP